MSRTPRNLSRLVLVATAGVAASVATPLAASAGSGDGDPVIVVESTGDQANAIVLPAAAQIGQSTQSTLAFDIDLSMSMSGQTEEAGTAMEMALTSEITEVLADGGYVALASLDSVEVTEFPEGADPSTVPCVGISGVQLEQTFDAAGNTTSVEPVDSGLGATEQACVEQFTSTQTQATVVFPAEPIGPGASWTADMVMQNQGMEMPVTYHYTLTDVSNGRYSIEATLDSDFDVSQDGLSATGTVSGSGNLSGAIDNPMDVSTSFKMNMDMESSSGGEDFSMAIDIAIDMLSAPAE